MLTLAHFMRLTFWGLMKLALCSFLLYSLLIYAPTGSGDAPGHNPCRNASDYAACTAARIRFQRTLPAYLAHSWGYDRPWPLSYLAWLFDQSETQGIQYGTNAKVAKGINVSIGGFQVRGSGLLTGDFGWAISVDFGRPVSDFFGPGPGLLFVFLTSLIATLMALVVAQRWRRPQPYRVSALPTSSALVDWWQLRSLRPIDAAVFRRQIA